MRHSVAAALRSRSADVRRVLPQCVCVTVCSGAVLRYGRGFADGQCFAGGSALQVWLRLLRTSPALRVSPRAQVSHRERKYPLRLRLQRKAGEGFGCGMRSVLPGLALQRSFF